MVVIAAFAVVFVSVAHASTCAELLGTSVTSPTLASPVRGMFIGGVSVTLEGNTFTPATATPLSNSSCAQTLCHCMGGAVVAANSTRSPSAIILGCALPGSVMSHTSCSSSTSDVTIARCTAQYSVCVATVVPSSAPVLHGAILAAVTGTSDEIAESDLNSGCIAAACYLTAAAHSSCATAFNDTSVSVQNQTCAAALRKKLFQTMTQTRAAPPPSTPVPTKPIPGVTPPNVVVLSAPTDNTTAAYKAWLDCVLQTYANGIGTSVIQPIDGRTIPTRISVSVSSYPTDITYTWLAMFTVVPNGGTISASDCAANVANAVNTALASPAYAMPDIFNGTGIATLTDVSLNVLPFPILADTTIIGSDTQYPLWALFLGIIIAIGFAVCVSACLTRTVFRPKTQGSLSDRLGGVTGEGFVQQRNMDAPGVAYVEL